VVGLVALTPAAVLQWNPWRMLDSSARALPASGDEIEDVLTPDVPEKASEPKRVTAQVPTSAPARPPAVSLDPAIIPLENGE
jgi:hypothetical protein